MFDIRSARFVVPLSALCFLSPSSPAVQAQEQQSSQVTEQGKETDSNWMGIAPFIPIPTLALNEEAKKSVRETEDRQLLERRALEDRYQLELRELLIKQAKEREALIARLSQP